MKSNITILICLIVSTISCANKPELTWQETLEINNEPTFRIDKEQLTNPDSFITLFTLFYFDNEDEMEEYLVLLRNYIDKVGYDPILYTTYISYIIDLSPKFNKSDLLGKILELYEKDSENALPCYYLSYYYAKKSDFKNSVKYLEEGNNRPELNRYFKEKKKIVFEYLYKKTNNEIFSYSSIIGVYVRELTLRYISAALRKQNSVEYPMKEIYKMGKKLDRNSQSIIDIIVTIGILYDGLDKEKNIEEIEMLEQRREYIEQLKIASEVYERKNKDDLIKYLKDLYHYNEIYAAKNTLNYKK